MILVTGGTGLVGSHLLRHLAEAGEEVRAIHRPGADLQGVREVFGYYDFPFGDDNGTGTRPPQERQSPAEPAGPATKSEPAGNAAGSKSAGTTESADPASKSEPAGTTEPSSPATPAGPASKSEPAGPASPAELFNRIEWVTADMLDPFSLGDALQGVSKVYHCAAIVSFDPSERKQVIRDNIDSTATIVDLCLDHKVKKLCHVSSVSALGSRYDDEPATEADLWKPSRRRNAYSISKFHSEMEVWRGIEEGLNAVIVNPSVILGPGNWKRGSAAFFTRIQKGMKYYTMGGTGFVDVRDVCRCMIALMESGISGERYIINGENLYYRDLFNMIADALGKPRPDTHASPFLVGAGWRLEWLRSKLTFRKPLLTRETARSGRKVSRYSNQKIRDTLGIEFTPISRTVAWTASLLPSREL